MPEQQETISLSKQSCAAIDKWTAKFPADQKQSAVLAALHIVQDENGGWLTKQLMDAVADYLAMPRIAVYEVANFYSMFDLEPVGRHKIYLCTNISCMLRGSKDIAEYLETKLGIKFGQTTNDGKITLREAECLGACRVAPMMQVDKTYHGNLTPEKIDQIISELE